MPRVIFGIALLQFGMLVVGLVRGKTLSLLFGPDGLGLLGAYDQLIVVLTQLGALGLPFAAMTVMSAATTSGRSAFNATFSRFLAIMTVLAIATTVTALVISFAWPLAFGQGLGKDLVLLRLAVLGIGPLMMTVFIAQTLVASQAPAEAALFGFVSATLLTGAAIAGSLINGLHGLYTATAFAGYGFVAAALIYLKLSRGLRLWPRRAAGSLLRCSGDPVVKTAFSIFCVLVGMSGSLLGARLLVLSELGETPAGLLQSALAITFSVGSVVAAIIGIQLAPSINRNIPVVTKLNMTGDALGYVTLLLCLGAIPIMLFPQSTLHLLYSRGFVGAATTLILCLFWQVVYQVLTIFQQLMISLGASLSSAAYLVTGFVASVVAIKLLIPSLGLIAAPLGLLCGASASLVFHAFHLWRAHRFHVARAPCIRVLVIGTVAVVSAFVLSLPSEFTVAGSLMRLALAVIAVLAAIFAGDRSERKSMMVSLFRTKSTNLL